MKTRDEIMQNWDSWREYIANGGTASWPRDAFEVLVDELFEMQSEIERLKKQSLTHITELK